VQVATAFLALVITAVVLSGFARWGLASAERAG
jgi:hypothetical protein